MLTLNNTWMISVKIKVFFHLMGIFVSGIASQTFMTLALKYEKASIVSILRSLTIIVNFIVDHVVFSKEFSFFPIVGSILIIIAVSILAPHEHYDDKVGKDKEKTLKILYKSKASQKILDEIRDEKTMFAVS